MRLPPVSVILTWPLPNYVDPPTRGPAVVVVNVVLSTLLIVAVSGRFYARIFIKHWFGVDDWMMILAFVFSICMAVVVSLATMHFGWDRHLWDVAPGTIQNANIIAFIAKFNFTMASTFTRLSLICFYYRLIKDSNVKWFRWLLHASVVWTASVGIAFVCLTIWLCVPVKCYWIYPPMQHCHCLSEGMVLVGGGVANVITDALVTLLPIPIVMRLQMPLRERVGICILLSIGVIVTIAGAVRTFYSWKGLIQSYDETWWTYPLWIAAAIEIELAAICACAPAWKSLLHQPLRDLSAKISFRFSSFRTRKSDPSEQTDNGQQKVPFFSPLKSLQWFQLKSLHFSTMRSLNVSSGNELNSVDEEFASRRDNTVLQPAAGGQVAAQVRVAPPTRSPSWDLNHYRGLTLCGGQSHESEILDTPQMGHSRPPLRITMEQRVDQTSSYDVSPLSTDSDGVE